AAVARQNGMSLEEAGRHERYAFLTRVAVELGPDALVTTAHTADDKAETVLLNITRGTGLAGLVGIPMRRGRIVRPLLKARRSNLRAWLIDAGIGFVDDRTNDDVRFARARIRHEVLPALERLNPAVRDALLRLAALAVDDNDVLDRLAAAELTRRRLPSDGGVRLDWHDAPPRAVGRRVIRLALGSSPPMQRVEAVLDAAEGSRGGVAIELGAGRRARVGRRVIELAAE
ncbi:MAG: tRNA lysidine(34) synthetase TilS, partial [Chloroflexota bacterium]|nr:tRNA lysidine(34) synthetase TilS [Chloroflexota bacterium]